MILRIDLKIFIFLILYYFTKQVKFYALVMVFAFIHELGHLLAGIILKMKVKKISIMPVGFSVEFRLNENDYNKKILMSNKLEIKKLIVAICGPLTNAFIILVVFFIKTEFVDKYLIIYSNLAVLIFNLIPIYPLDRRQNFKVYILFNI